MVRSLVLMALLAAGCATGPAASASLRPLPPGHVYLPSWAWTLPSGCLMGGPTPIPSDGEALCVVTGHGLEGILEGSDGCTSIVVDGTGDRRTLIWPPGFSATFDPLVVFDDRGAVVAKGGDFVTADASEPSGATPNPCGGQPVAVSSMRSSGPP